MSNYRKGKKGGAPPGPPGSLPNRVRLMWADEGLSSGSETSLPAMDIYEIDDNLVIEIELPGVRKEAIELYVINNLVAVEGVKGEQNLSAAANQPRLSYLQLERKFGRFYREIELPVACNTAEVKARFQNGVLSIEFKKVKDQRGERRRIPLE